MATAAVSQYRKIQDYDDVLWNPNTPVLVEKMRLAFDRVHGTNVLLITFRSLTTMNIYGLSIGISLRDGEGKPMYQEVSYNYYGMETPSGRTFGGEEGIIVEPEARSFEITVFRVELSDGQFYRGEDLLRRLPPELPLSSLGEWEHPFLDKMDELYPKVRPVCAPENKESYWRCVCKRIYPHSMDKCPYCRVKAATLLDIVPELKREKRRRADEAARQERERRAEEERRRREEEEHRAEEERLRREEEERRAEEERRRQEEEAEARRNREEQKKLFIKRAGLGAAAALLLVAAIVIPVRLIDRHNAEQAAAEAAAAAQVTAAPTPMPTPTPVPKVTPEPADTPTPETSPPVVIETGRHWDTTVILGADLSETQTRTVWRLFGTREKALEEYDKLEVTQEKGAQFLTALCGKEHVESRALSGVLLQPGDPGSGLQIFLYNIDFCTEEDYRTVLEDLEFTDGTAIIAAPESVSGTTALAGLLALADHMEDYVGQGIGTATAKRAMNVRSGPDVSFGRYAYIPANTSVEVLEILENGWYKIVWTESAWGYAYTCNQNGIYYTYTPNAED